MYYFAFELYSLCLVTLAISFFKYKIEEDNLAREASEFYNKTTQARNLIFIL